MVTTQPAAPTAVAAVAPLGRRSERASLGLGLALVVLTVWASFSSGATSLPQETRIQVALLVVAGAAALAWAGGLDLRLRTTRVGAAGLVGLAGFAAFCGLSLGWTITPESTWILTNRTLAYALAALLAVVAGATDPRTAARLPVALLAGVTLVALYAFGTKALPGVHVDGVFDLDQSGFVARLRSPLGYWNALGLLCALGLPVGLRLATSIGRSLRDRALGLSAAFLLVCTIGLTYSRGAIIALATGLVVLTVLGPGRLRGLALAVALGVAAVPVLGVAYTLDSLSESSVALADRSEGGRVLLGVFLVCLAALLVGLVALIGLERRVGWTARRTREVFRAMGILAALAVLAGTVGVALSAKGLPQTVSDRWAAFTEPGDDETLQASRLTDDSSGNRWSWWSEAGGAWSDKPLAGWGAGSFRALHLRYRQNEVPVTEAHSTPMQLLSETGLIGTALALGGILALLATGLARVRESRSELEVAAFAAACAWVVHGLYDWDFDFPAVTLPAMALLGVLAARGPTGPAAVRVFEPGVAGGRVAGLGLAAVAVVVAAGSAVLPAWAQGKAADAQAAIGGAASVQQLEDAAAQADLAARLDPLAIGPLQASAAIAERRGRLLDARRFALEAVERQPDSSAAWLGLAQYSFRLFDREGFERAALRALALDPRSAVKRQVAADALAFRTPAGVSPTATGTPLAPAAGTVAPVGTGATGVTGPSVLPVPGAGGPGTTGPTGAPAPSPAPATTTSSGGTGPTG